MSQTLKYIYLHSATHSPLRSIRRTRYNIELITVDRTGTIKCTNAYIIHGNRSI